MMIAFAGTTMAQVASFSWTPNSPCAGSTVQLTSTSTGTALITTYVYSLTGATQVTVLAQNPVVTFTASGTQTVVLIIGTGTVPVSSATNNIIVQQQPTVGITSSSSLACPFSSVILTATSAPAGNTYSWNAPATGTNAATTVTVYPQTVFSVVVTGSNSCKTTASYTQALNIPSVSISIARSGTICAGESNTFVASGTGNSYTWNPGAIANATAVVTPTTTTIYTLTVGYTVCPSVSNSFTLSQAVSPCTGINALSNGEITLGVYPNPTSGDLTVEFANGLVKTIEVMDLTGRIVLSNATSDDKIKLNLSNLSKGIYYVRVKSDNKVEVKKIVKD